MNYKGGPGVDLLTLNSGASLKKLIVDFGDGTDSFVDNFGLPAPFNTKFKNLP